MPLSPFGALLRRLRFQTAGRWKWSKKSLQFQACRYRLSGSVIKESSLVSPISAGAKARYIKNGVWGGRG